MKLFWNQRKKAIFQELEKYSATQSNGSDRAGTICFLILQAKEETCDSVPSIITKATDIVLSNKAVLQTIFSSFIFCSYGFPFEDDGGSFERCTLTANQLTLNLKNDVRVIYGKANGMYAGLGNTQTMRPGPIIPNLSDKLKTLLALEYGTSCEII